MSRVRYILLSVLLALVPLTSRAATALLLFQGDFNGDSVLEANETSRWAVTYSGSTLKTGQDLLLAVFGTPHAIPSTSFSITNPVTFADGNTWQITYGDGVAADFIESVTLNGKTLINNSDFSVRGSSWNYWAAKGDSGFIAGDPFNGIVDAAGWHSSGLGITSRTLSDPSTMSFDGWAFGDNGFDPDTFEQFPPLSISGYSPNISSFSDSGVNVINLSAAPEPGRVTLLLLGGLLISQLRRKSSKG